MSDNFNKDFDAELGRQLIECLKNGSKCIVCEGVNATLRCSACRTVWYCSKVCQKKDWKAGHKDICANWCCNRDDGVCVPVNMRSQGYIDEEVFKECIMERLHLFLKEFNRMSKLRRFPPGVHLQIAVIQILGRVRLGMATTMPGSENSFVDVNHIPLLPIDDGEAAAARINQGSGTISEAAKEKALEHLCMLVALFKEYEIFPVSITFGRGLMFMSSDTDFTDQIKEAGNGYMMFMPSSDYAMDNVMDAAMRAAFGRR